MRQSLPGIDDFRRPRRSRAVTHCDAALMSLPHLFKTRLETIPAAVPYLRRAGRAVASAGRQRLADA